MDMDMDMLGFTGYRLYASALGFVRDQFDITDPDRLRVGPAILGRLQAEQLVDCLTGLGRHEHTANEEVLAAYDPANGNDVSSVQPTR